ncbi:MAG: hypothetical protein NTX25_22545 [Proteobacteria bacterium]|nr:hypothetical protein [Pseudomonadota bacterium]
MATRFLIKGTNRVALPLQNGSFVPGMRAELPCKSRGPEDLEQIQSLVTYAMSQQSQCQMSFTDPHTLEVSSGCSRSRDLTALTSAQSLTISQTSNFIAMYTGSFVKLSEPDILSMLAHELGHYYRSHSTAPSSDYNYYYTLDPIPQPSRPLAESDKESWAMKLAIASRIMLTKDMITTLSEQKIHSGLYFSLGSLIQSSCHDATHSCSETCQEAYQLIEDSAFAASMGHFPYATDTTANLSAYREFESKGLACLETLSVPSAKESARDQGLSAVMGVLKAHMLEPTWPEWQNQTQQTDAAKSKYMQKTLFERFQNVQLEGLNFRKAFVATSERLSSQDRNAEAALKEAYELHITQYTKEQEADELSLEWLSQLGVDPHAMLKLSLDLGRLRQTSLGGYSLGFEACQELKDRGWKLPDGSPAFVPLGNFTDPHHNFCYRAFNAEREIDAHHWQAAATSPVVWLDPTAWQKLQATASELTIAPVGEKPNSLD